MEGMKKRSLIIFLTILLFSSCAILYPSIRRSKKLYKVSNNLKKEESTANYKKIILDLSPFIKKGTTIEEVYPIYINSEYNLALLDPMGRHSYYEKAAIAAATWVNRFKEHPLANYYLAKTLYLLESQDKEIIVKIIAHSNKAIAALDKKKFSYEVKELKRILDDVNNNTD
jgi:hypothetical protein